MGVVERRVVQCRDECLTAAEVAIERDAMHARAGGDDAELRARVLGEHVSGGDENRVDAATRVGPRLPPSAHAPNIAWTGFRCERTKPQPLAAIGV